MFVICTESDLDPRKKFPHPTLISMQYGHNLVLKSTLTSNSYTLVAEEYLGLCPATHCSWTYNLETGAVVCRICGSGPWGA